VIVYPSGNKIGLGLRQQLPNGLPKDEVTKVPAQKVSPEVANEGASAVVFFVAELQDDSGKVWKADLEKMEAEASASASAVHRSARHN
jgi:hypothetical protein